eukprot:s4373_g5.t1
MRAAWEALVRKMPQAGTANCCYDERVVAEWKGALRKIVGAEAPLAVRIKGKREYKSPLDAEILEAWSQKSGDPETEVQKWVREGAPLSIEKPIGTCGIFPKNHADTMVEARYENLGYVTRVSSREVDDTMPRKTVSRLGLIVKEKPTGEIKRRIVIDLRRSGGNDKSSLPEKLVLPRPKDAVDMMRNVFDQRQPFGAGSNYGRELAVIDISDAFMTLGVHPDEHPHTLSPSLEEGTYYMFIALLFGYKTAPLLWSRVAAQWARLAQSFFSGHEAQHQVYLDNALWMLQGELSERHSHLALVLNTAAALGFKVALAKGERGPHVQWIGVRFALVEESIILTVPERYVRDLVDKLKAWESKGMAPIKELRQVAGKASWMSGLLPRTRWTVSVLYIESCTPAWRTSSRARRTAGEQADQTPGARLFPVKQVEQPRRWLISYLEEALCKPSRKLRLDLGKYPKAAIITDASPEGLGAILTINNRVVRIMASQVTAVDALELGFQHLASSSQGVVETLAVLVALRLWEKELQSCQVQLVVESDSLIALATSQRLAGSDPALNFLGAEISIACEGAGIEGLVARHIPGTANVSAEWRPPMRGPACVASPWQPDQAAGQASTILPDKISRENQPAALIWLAIARCFIIVSHVLSALGSNMSEVVLYEGPGPVGAHVPAAGSWLPLLCLVVAGALCAGCCGVAMWKLSRLGVKFFMRCCAPKPSASVTGQSSRPPTTATPPSQGSCDTNRPIPLSRFPKEPSNLATFVTRRTSTPS